MNVKLISFAIATALFASGALANQPQGRDSVYAVPGGTSSKATAITARNGRDSVYAIDMPASTSDRNRGVPVGLAEPGRV